MTIYDPIADILGLSPVDCEFTASDFHNNLIIVPWNKGVRYKSGAKRPDLAALNQSRRGIPLSLKRRQKLSECNPRYWAGKKNPHMAAWNRANPTINPHAFDEYNAKKKAGGFTPEEIENKRKAGRARKGKVMSDEGRANMSRAAIERWKKIKSARS